MTKSLVIVESPAKARTIAGYLGDDYVVESSIGHIRDLPRKTSQVPKELKDRFARTDELGVDVEDGFTPFYVVDSDKKEQITKLKKLLKQADTLYLATDEDREGESIAWHLLEVLKPTVPVKRMVFHEITKKAIRNAIEQPREIDRRLVDAQEARRILDRLYGYKVSPVLWKKVMPKLSAGRVQSVATRIIVERERARIRFRQASYWDIEADFDKADGGGSLTAKLTGLDGKRLATGKDFGEDGRLTRENVVVLDQGRAERLAADLKGAAFTVTSVERKPYKRSPAAPFMTSTLQQEASRKLRFSAQRTMRTAQRLYESGYITYMRTDSTTLADVAVSTARKLIEDLYGKDYVPAKPPSYAKKVKNAQEAHEAIRPAGEQWRTPEAVAREVGTDEAKLYELVWKRTVASQMEDARGETLSVRIGGETADHRVELSVSGRTITFPGFFRAYVEGSDDPEAELENRERPLPPLAEKEPLKGRRFEPQGHETQPPARFTEASLVRALEELGVGRPSTYASTLHTIMQREYVWKKGSALVPSFKAFAVISLLEKHFPRLVDYAFTARMEDELDAIASGEEEVVPWLERFYLGDGQRPANEDGIHMEVGLKEMVSEKLGEIDAQLINSLPLGQDEDGYPIAARVGRFGPYLERDRGQDRAPLDGVSPDELTVSKAVELLSGPSTESHRPEEKAEDPTAEETKIGKDAEGHQLFARVGPAGRWVVRDKKDRASIPEDLPPDELTLAKALEMLAAPSGDRVLGKDPETGEPVIARTGRYGPYVQLGQASSDRKEKPKTSSLFKSMELETITLEQALKLLSLPRVVGVDQDGAEVLALNGRFGPYLEKAGETGKETRSLESEEQIFSITLEEAKKILAQPKQHGRRRATTEPLKTLGADPVSGQPIQVKEGRWGPFVTDGETNASLRKGDDPTTITTERAAELIQARRERGPSKRKKRGSKKAASKKTAKKKKTSKKTAKKKTSKKTAKKKTSKKTAKKKTSKKAAAGD